MLPVFSHGTSEHVGVLSRQSRPMASPKLVWEGIPQGLSLDVSKNVTAVLKSCPSRTFSTWKGWRRRLTAGSSTPPSLALRLRSE
jgi:hypothetical protein